MFIEFNDLYSTQYSIDSIDVTNRQTGSFWVDCNDDMQTLINNRIIIDLWCDLNRAKEEKVLIERDVELFLSHIQSDIELLSGEVHFNEGLNELEIRAYKILIKRRIRYLQDESIAVSGFQVRM